ncbi:LysR family transcriptional regulator [Bradyrhizobium sp.]|uniref:LysR family transcriptional regulator n=1 Tax=Bradyrhizobium sp. TaxID=376 RepID=UPI003BB00197
MIDLRSLTVFVKVSEHRSFAKAARDLGITQSGVSNAVSRLEERLGGTLARPQLHRPLRRSGRGGH